MQKNRKKHIITSALLAAAMACQPAVLAGRVDYVNIDDAIVNTSSASSVSQENGGEIKYNLYAGDSFTATDGETFTITCPKYSFYKSHLITKTPASFAASGKQLCTVFEVKFKAEPKDPAVEYKPKINYGLRYLRGGAAASFIENQKESSHLDTDGEWITLKYMFNPVTGTVSFYKDGELIQELTDDKLKTGDIEEIRFYPRTIPEKNGEGLYPNGKPTLDFSGDDGTVVACTPVVWTYDYVKIYQLTPFEVQESEPAEGGTGASVSGPFRVTFDSDMKADTFNPSTVQLELEADGSTMMGRAALTAPDTCEFTPYGSLEYFSNYRLALLPGVLDMNEFGHAEAKYIRFTTEKRPIKEVIDAAGAEPVSITADGADTDVLKAGALGGAYMLENTGEAREVVISTVLYQKIKDSETGAYVNRAEQKITVEPGVNSVKIPSVTVTDAENSFVKIMVWTEDGYPLTDAIVCNAEGIQTE